METLIRIIKIYSQDIGMRFGIEKCAILKRRKREAAEGTELQNQEIIRTDGEKKLRVFGSIRKGHHQISKDEGKIKKKYPRRTRKLREIKLCSRNLNTSAIPFVRFLGLFLKWTREELLRMEEKIHD